VKSENFYGLLSIAQKLRGQGQKIAVDRGDPQPNKCGPGIRNIAKVIQNLEIENFQSPESSATILAKLSQAKCKQNSDG
jgi:hypothetical protein